MRKILLLVMSMSILFSACNKIESESDPVEIQTYVTKDSDILNGLELFVSIDKSQYSLDEEIVAQVKVINHSDEAKKLTVYNGQQQIAFLHTQQAGWNNLFQPEPLNDPTFTEGVVDIAEVYTIDAEETLEQEFKWQQQVIDELYPFDNSTLPAPSGDYQLHAFLAIGEMSYQQNETINEMMDRYNKKPLDSLNVELHFSVDGNRQQLSREEAIELVYTNKQASDWYEARTSEHLMREKGDKWQLKDRGGEWTTVNEEHVEQLKDIQPSYTFGQRQNEKIELFFDSFFGGEPYKMIVKIDTVQREVLSVKFE